MTFGISSTHVSTDAANSPPIRHDVSGVLSFRVWHAVRGAFHFTFDVVDDASRLRRRLHRRYSVTEE